MFFSRLRLVAMGVIFVLLSACATTGTSSEASDPIEPVNRQLFAFHQWFDEHFFRPAAVVYRALVPPPARKSVSNFFLNVDEVPIAVNHLAQGHLGRATKSTARLLINTSFGIGGLFDVATEMGIERRKADLGQTMARWGWRNSTYVFVPLLGPTTFRDGIGLIGDLYFTPFPYLPDSYEWSIAVLFAVDERSKYMDAEDLMAIAALDEYVFLRDAYMQSRTVFIEDPDSGYGTNTGHEGDIL